MYGRRGRIFVFAETRGGEDRAGVRDAGELTMGIVTLGLQHVAANVDGCHSRGL